MDQLAQEVNADILACQKYIKEESLITDPLLEPQPKIYSLAEILKFFQAAQSNGNGKEWFTIRKIFLTLRKLGITVTKGRLYKSINTIQSHPKFKELIEVRSFTGPGSPSDKESYEYRLKEINPRES